MTVARVRIKTRVTSIFARVTDRIKVRTRLYSLELMVKLALMLRLMIMVGVVLGLGLVLEYILCVVVRVNTSANL